MTQLLIDRATLEQLLVALEEVSDYINRYSIPAHQLELDPIDESIKTLNAALANAEQPVSINDDAFWSSAMKSINPISVDAEGLALWLDSFPRRWPELDQAAALLRAQAATAPQPAPKGEPVCHGCGIPAGDVHMSTCKSGKWPSRVSNGDTAAPAPQAQQAATKNCPQPEICGSKECEFCRDTDTPAPQVQECTRSHPHELMDGYCELRTEIAQCQREKAREE